MMPFAEKFDLIASHYRRLATRHWPETVCVIPIETKDGHTHVFYCTPSQIPETLRRMRLLRGNVTDVRRFKSRLLQLAMLYQCHGGDPDEL